MSNILTCFQYLASAKKIYVSESYKSSNHFEFELRNEADQEVNL